MVYQIKAGYTVAGRMIKVPQVYIIGAIRATILAETPAGSSLLNQLHFITPTPPVTLADCQAVAGFLAVWINAKYRQLCHSGITFKAVHARSMEGYIVPTHTLPLSLNGTLTGDAMPFDTSLPVQLTSGLTGGENSGEFFPFYPDEAANNADGSPNSTYRGLVQDALEDLQTSALSAGYPLVIASYTYTAVQEVTGVVTGLQWGVQRRRLVRYGK